MAPPVWANGQVLTASDVNTWFVGLVGYKTADLARTSATLTADPDLTVPAAASSTYMAEVTLFYKSAAGGNNLTWTWTLPAGAGGQYAAAYLNSGGSNVIEANAWSDPAHSAGAVAAGNIYAVSIRGNLTTTGTAASFTLNWAASSGTITLTARSYLCLTRIG